MTTTDGTATKTADMRQWRKSHPVTSLYIAAIVTIELIVQVAWIAHHGGF